MFDRYRFQLGKPLLLALLTAFALRLAWGIAIPIVPVSDSHAYDVFAQNLAQGHGYGWEPGRPSAYWPVGTSAVYALLFRFFGHDYTVVMLFQVAVGVAVVALAASLARRWFGAPVALATGWILACWPLLIQYTTILASELFFVFFVLLAFWIALLPGLGWFARALLSGAALAGASYVRPIALIMAPFLFMKEAVENRRWREALLACAVSAAVMTACILPWSARNWHVFDRFVLISTNGGANLWMGNNPHADTGYMELPDLKIANEADRDAYLRDRAREYIAQEPAAFLKRTGRKVISLHDRESIGIAWNEKGIVQRVGQGMLAPLKLISSVYWWAILAAAGLGMFALAKNSGVVRFLTCPAIAAWAYFTIVHSLTVAGDRYHVPSVPFIAMIAAYALCARRASKPGAIAV